MRIPTAFPGRILTLLCTVMLAVALLPPRAGAQDTDEVTPARVGGATRVDTAANVATLTFEQADVAHLAYAGNFPDALAASFAAGSVEGPVLLSGSEEVPEATMAVFAELDVRQVVLVGGEAVLGQAVAEQVAAAGYEVDRVSGVNRYQTASAVAMRYGTAVGVGEVASDRTAVMAGGEDFPDALVAGSVAAGLGLPLFLTPRDRTEFSVNTSLEQLDIERIIVVGGTAAVASEVVLSYEDAGYEMERWSGATRLETAQVTADNLIERLGFSPALTLVARGDTFPDALAASVHAGARSAPLLLAQNPTVLGNSNLDWLSEQCPAVDTIRAIGGTAALAPVVLDSALSAASICFEPEPTGMIGTPSTEDRRSEEFPGPGETAQLVRVRAAEHDGFDRVVFEFDGPDQPGWITRTDVPPATAAGSGEPVPVDGDAFIDVATAFAVARYAGGTYDGPDRIAVDGEVVTELVLTGDFESQLEWAVGLETAAAYAVGLLDNPVRLVIDVAHE